MNIKARRTTLPLILTVCFLLLVPAWLRAAETVLPSWNDGPARKAVLEFVARTTTPGGPDFVPEEDRIAVFDNDGTLWCEHPAYFQMMFAMDLIGKLAPAHPEWAGKEPFKAILGGDPAAIAALDREMLSSVFMSTYMSMTVDEYREAVLKWAAKAWHPRYQRPYTECVYQPMLELLAYLGEKGFKCFIVSGSDLDFMRPWAERVYKVPTERVVGSNAKMKVEVRDGKPVILRLPEVEATVNGDGKIVAIHKYIGKRPILAFGNSDGDLSMLHYTAAGPGARFMAFIHHDDAEREYAYDRTSDIGRLKKGLDDAARLGWTVVSMKSDFARIFPEAR